MDSSRDMLTLRPVKRRKIISGCQTSALMSAVPHSCYTCSSLGSSCQFFVTTREFTNLQKKLKLSLHRTWKNALVLDWISPEKAKSLPLLEYYTGLRWTKMVKALKNYKLELNSIYDIFNMIDTAQPPQAVNIFVEAEPGMGKTCSLALLALKWVDGTESQRLGSFDLVFLLRLRYVNKISSLPEMIRMQHDGLENVSDTVLKEILFGDTGLGVLLMLDGYDEYKPGTNKYIDRAIMSTIGNCFLILTCRSGNYLNKHTRDQMDGEIIIEGFSEENISSCIGRYTGDPGKSKEFLEHSRLTGIDVLLHIPIILVMAVVVFMEEESLPETKTGIYQTIFRLAMDRTTWNTFGCKSSDIANLEDLLYTLGELSWNALQNDVKQLLLKKEEIEHVCPWILDLGLLHEVGADVLAITEHPTLLSFQQKTLHEFASGFYIGKRLDRVINAGQDVKKVLRQLFPSWFHVLRNQEVVIFASGQMINPVALVTHAFDMYIERELNLWRTTKLEEEAAEQSQLEAEGKNIDGLLLFHWLYAESAVPLVGSWNHNGNLNYYDHREDDNCMVPRDVTPVTTPSKLYWFNHVKEEIFDMDEKQPPPESTACNSQIQPQDCITCSNQMQPKLDSTAGSNQIQPPPESTACNSQIQQPETESTLCSNQIASTPESTAFYSQTEPPTEGTACNNLVHSPPECAIYINQPGAAATHSLLFTCYRISQRQPITDLVLRGVRLENSSKIGVPQLSRNAKSLTLGKCFLPLSFLKGLLCPLAECNTLQMLWLSDIDLSDVEEELDAILERLVNIHQMATGVSHRHHQQRELRLWLIRTNLSREFKDKWSHRCDQTDIGCYVI